MLSRRDSRLVWLVVCAIGLALFPVASAETEADILRPSDGVMFDNFGRNSDIDGSLMIVGAPFHDIGGDDSIGAAYIFEDDGDGTWTEIKKLVSPDGVAFDQFGSDVAISGDTVVVGATGAPIGPNSSEGAAYIFDRNRGGADNWGFVKKLRASTNVENLAEFGGAVAIDGTTIAVGARAAYSAQNGAVFLFERDEPDPGGWGVVQDLTDDLFDSNAGFGVDVALFSNVLVVGADLLDSSQGAFNNTGGIYVFTRNSGTWSQSIKLLGSLPDSNGAFGRAVAIDANVIVAGASNSDSLVSGAGAAFVFEKTGPDDDDWTETGALISTDGANNHAFGRSVAVQAGVVIVGASGVSGIGKAYRFEFDGSDWQETNTFTPSDGVSGDIFGRSAAIGGGVIAIGSSLVDEGGVYLYPSPIAGPGAVPPGTLMASKVAGSTQVLLSWSASCATAADDYGVFEGEVGNWYSHEFRTCSDAGGDLMEQILPTSGSRYFLVVPNSSSAEGSYGRDGAGAERPVGTTTCAASYEPAPCP